MHTHAPLRSPPARRAAAGSHYPRPPTSARDHDRGVPRTLRRPRRPSSAAPLIDGASIRRNSITAAQICNRTRGTQDLSDRVIRALTATPARSVGPSHLAVNAVDAAKIAPGAVTTRALGTHAVDTQQLADGAVTATQLAGGAVTGSRVTVGAIGTAAVADGGLTTSDIGDIYGTVVVDFKPFELNECQTVRIDAPQSTSAQSPRSPTTSSSSPAPPPNSPTC